MNALDTINPERAAIPRREQSRSGLQGFWKNSKEDFIYVFIFGCLICKFSIFFVISTVPPLQARPLSHLPLKFMPSSSKIIIMTYILLGPVNVAHQLTGVELTTCTAY